MLLDVKGLSFAYTSQRRLFENISFTLQKGECLAIIGKNGKGKSTLLNTIAGELQQLSGSIDFHTSSSVAHFGQTNIAHLDANNSVMDEIYAADPKLPEASVRAICGAMMFGGESAKKKISLLSGGEKSRVMLGQILAKQVNVLLLDEPTNHLDMESIEALTKAIQNFKGSVIIVTHSEELLRRVADRLIIFAQEGAEYFDGGYDTFLEKIGWEEEEQSKQQKNSSKPNKKENKKQRAALVQERSKLTSPLKKELVQLEEFIVNAEEELSVLHEQLIEASKELQSSKVMELSKLVSDLEAEVEQKFEDLENTQNKLDTLLDDYEEKLAQL